MVCPKCEDEVFEFEFIVTKALDIIYALLKAGDTKAAIAFLEEALK